MKSVKLYWWKPTKGLKKIFHPRHYNMSSNFGDELSQFIVEETLKTSVERVKSEQPNKLLAIGSILHHAQNGDTIWGSGINGNNLNITVDHLNILSVRGPMTRNYILKKGINCPELYGDPGLLVSKYYKPKTNIKKREFGIIPHYTEVNHPALKIHKHLIIDPRMPLKSVIDQIYSCEYVLSSSLHGLVVADSYGIPSVHLRITDNEPDFKYHDYYNGTDRDFNKSLTGIRFKNVDFYKNFNCDLERIADALITWYKQP